MIDFKQIKEHCIFYNFHSHTQFCDGHADMEDFVKEAINEHFTDYGFSPHSPIPFDSPCNMHKDAANEYIAEYNRLKDKYGNKINLYLSMEIDYLGKQWGPSNEYFDSLPLDYRIGSVHFIPSFDDKSLYIDIDGNYQSFKKKMELYFYNDIKAVVESFYHQSIEMIEAGGFDIIGHFDKIGHNAGHFWDGIENEKWYEDLFMQTFEAIMDNHLIIEINTKAYLEHSRFFPNLKYFNLLKTSGAEYVVNSDAHYPSLINSGRFEAMKLLGDLIL